MNSIKINNEKLVVLNRIEYNRFLFGESPITILYWSGTSFSLSNNWALQ